MNQFTKDKPTSQQLVELLDNELDITICRDVVNGLDFEYKQLQNQNKGLQQEHEYDVRMIDDVKGECVKLYKENKQLKQERDKYKSNAEKLEKIILELYEENKRLLNHLAIDKLKELEEGNSNE